PPNHPKWREVNLAVTLKDWKRFEPAEEWLASARSPDVASLQADFRQFTSQQGGAQRAPISPARSDELFQKFLRWKQSRPTRENCVYRGNGEGARTGPNMASARVSKAEAKRRKAVSNIAPISIPRVRLRNS